MEAGRVKMAKTDHVCRQQQNQSNDKGAAKNTDRTTAALSTASIKKSADATSKYLGFRLAGSPDELYEAARHLIAHGGKRLRPYMVMKSCQVLGGRASDARRAAAAVEMVHNFTLIHDDIMDGDEMRHGVPTVHKKYGLSVSILAGDVLFSKAYQTLAGSSIPGGDAGMKGMVSRLAAACVEVCEGQMLDIKMAESGKIPSESEYINMIKKKTAALFDVSCALGAICAGGSSADVARLSRFGQKMGISFQITDDLIGAMGDPDVTKKPVGNDIREGKKSLPILMALEAARGTEHLEIIEGAFGNSRVSKSGLEQAVESVRALGIEDKARAMACRHAEGARREISSYKTGASKELGALLDFVVKRDA